jgi:MFS family permease
VLTDPAYRRVLATYFCFSVSVDGFLLFPVYIKQLGGTELAIGLLMAFYSAANIACRPVVGGWIDRAGRRPAMTVGALVIGAAALAATWTTTLPGLAVVRLAQGVGAAAFFAANISYLIDVVPRDGRGRALSLFGVAPLASAALTPLAAQAVVRHSGFPALFGLCAVLAGLTALLLRGAPERRPDTKAPPGRDWSRASLQYVWRRPIGLTVCFGMGSGTLFTFAGTYAQLLDVRNLALFYAVYGATGIAVRLFAGGVIDSQGRRRVIIPSTLAQTTAAAVLALVALAEPGSPLIIAAIVVAGLAAGTAHGYLFPCLLAVVADEAPEERRGFVMGLFSAALVLGQTAGPALFGCVAYALGYGPMWAGLAALLLGSWGLSLGLADPGRTTSALRQSRAGTSP